MTITLAFQFQHLRKAAKSTSPQRTKKYQTLKKLNDSGYEDSTTSNKGTLPFFLLKL
jgi:hypothetical protein